MINLTQDQKNECREVFDFYDKDRDGYIKVTEIGDVLRALGANPTENELDEMSRKVGAEKCDFGKFFNFFAEKMQSPDKEEDLIEAFKIFDKEGNFKISAQELRHAMTTLGEKLSPQEADDLIKQADSDNDGVIDYKEFIKIMLTK
jgi:calmodulin